MTMAAAPHPKELEEILALDIVPSQVIAAPPSTAGTRLALAVLAQAIEDLVRTDVDVEDRAAAALWLLGASARLSFELVAEGLRHEPGALRVEVLRRVAALRGANSMTLGG